jgi:hypothetical protein
MGLSIFLGLPCHSLEAQPMFSDAIKQPSVPRK